MAGFERRPRDVHAHPTSGAGDEPGLLAAHLVHNLSSLKWMTPRKVVAASCCFQESTRSPRVTDPVETASVRVSQSSEAGSTLDLVDTKKEIREFLTSRRARITPEQVGLVSYGARRVAGVRSEEVAVLAGVSVPSSPRLERGDMSGASANVLE